MADAAEIGEGMFLAKGTIRELWDGRRYVVTTSGMQEEMREVVCCGECRKRLPKGWMFDEHCNEAKEDACNLHSDHDFDWNYTSFFYVNPTDYCTWGERKEGQ